MTPSDTAVSKVTSTSSGQAQDRKLPALSAVGSVASLVALAVVLIDKASAAGSIDPQMLVWRIGLAFMSLMAAGATIMITYDYVRSTVPGDSRSARSSTARCALAMLAGALVTTAFLDGLFAAVYWHVWLAIVSRFVHWILGT